ncbi:hypothetical protein CC79DRAFT_1318149 [Sarocladium strictum]
MEEQSIREFEVLIALCKTAPTVQSEQNAKRLSYQLKPYIIEAPEQKFDASPFFRQVNPNPNEALAFNVSGALLSLGIKYPNLQADISDNIWTFLSRCNHVMENIVASHAASRDNLQPKEAMRTATLVISLLGFLDAASAQAHFWKTRERLSLIRRVSGLLSDQFLIAAETAISTLFNAHAQERDVKEWKRYLRHYSAGGRPLGALLLQRSFMWLVVASTSLEIADEDDLRHGHVLDIHMSRGRKLRVDSAMSEDDIAFYAGVAIDKINYIKDGADFVLISSPSNQRLAYELQASAIVSYLNCCMLNEEVAEPETLLAWLQDIMENDDLSPMADVTLASVALRSLALICSLNPASTSVVSRMLTAFIVSDTPGSETIAVASKSLATILKMLSKDSVISTLYTLGNELSPQSETAFISDQANGHAVDGTDGFETRNSDDSNASLPNEAEKAALIYGNVVQALCGIAAACEDEQITALAQSVLLQKLDKINTTVDAKIVVGAADLALTGGLQEFRSLLKLYARMSHNGVVDNKEYLLVAVRKARTHLSANLRRDSGLFEIYWEHLLDNIIALGDAHASGETKEFDVQLAAREIAELLQPLAVLMSSNDLVAEPVDNDELYSLLRDAWFNIVVHGFISSTERGKKYINELRLIAIHSPPLVAEKRSEQVESDIELNTVLRRGNTNDRESMQRKLLIELIPSKAADIKSLSYRKTIFLHAAYLVESLRAEAGDCTKVLSYFMEPSMRKAEVRSTMEGVATAVVEKYLRKTLGGVDPTFSAQYVAAQLATIFCSCCCRIERVQQAAFACADRIIRDVPSSLCYKSSLFALLELLSLMWSSCLEAELDKYSPRSTFRSEIGKVSVELSDDYEFRRWTLDILNRKAKGWVKAAISLAPMDVKGLLQTYLSEFDDEGAYGHISLGRSFAMELGSMLPTTDQRLQSLERVGDCDINTASDLIAQYTTRQEYRYGEALPDRGTEVVNYLHPNRRSSFMQHTGVNDSVNAATVLAHAEARILSKKTTSLPEVREILRRAAAALCRSPSDESAVARYLVSIPFDLFTKQSIKLGVSLWLGVINENPLLESRLVNEIAQQWETTIHRKVGLFSSVLTHPDPFFLKEEFAPSDLEALTKRRQHVHDLLSPHVRLLQFFSSHFNASRFGSIDTRYSLLRMLDLTLEALKESPPHPMARELRFQILLYGLRCLRYSTTIGAAAQWRLKDKILTAGLSWFRGAPKWSFGSNILQLKTEIRLIADVIAALNTVSFIGAHTVGGIKSLQAKEQLFQILLENEQNRLAVWSNPLSHHATNVPVHVPNKSQTETALVSLVRTAWWQDPAIAIELATRFYSPRLHKDIRFLLLNMPERAIAEEEALPIIFGGQLPVDCGPMLKYLLFWQRVNPITAVTMFMPVYKNHPFVIQYAMRTLESHSVDVTFFYVPQIVQSLRYDTLGYVERYILETAQFSQLFAHQIIWNMKANSYKDDDAQVPDAIKPTLDGVMSKMVNSFASVDREFYEKEFAFFDEVTDISGKLKPFIKRPKPEKKQKIEEELRKIKVEVGVYLPSNPDGVVIGIDRKSGKPLQSHAKAPYMATFRIRKNKGGLDEVDDMLEETNKHGEEPHENTIEVWQSAIFKVGDDCRQDVLALQMIAAFRGIFHNVGLDVYVFPYRVTATAPGCGVIDVLPNSISRDMLGREAVNGLYDYFISKYGNEDSLRFQQARNNFVKSMAAYSVISFLLQFKDRHNGNIMIDDAGHILHIDFGFCFDIAPGGIKFERAPFKLTSEMMAVMGGSPDHQSFKMFEELCVKAFLASRQYAEKLSQIVLLMMDSGLPCFKPESVMHFRERFVLEKSEREAADFMKDLIKKSYSSYSTGIYDQFQLLTNGIPY